jgi:hypothetical protein
MKGGKQGRKRRSGGGGAGRKGVGRGGTQKRGPRRPWSTPSGKSGKEKPLYGGLRTSGDE